MSDFDSSVEGVSSFSGTAREGLPPSYRMRAEGHYVDLLATRSSAPREKTLAIRDIVARDCEDEPATALVESIRRYGVLQPLLVQEVDEEYRVIAGHQRLAAAERAGLRDVPCIVHAVSDDKATKLADAAAIVGAVPVTAPEPVAAVPEPIAAPVVVVNGSGEPALHAGASLSQSLTAIAACVDLLTDATSPLSRAALANLVRAEAWRATTLVMATRIVRGELTPARAALPVLTVLDGVARGFVAEGRVRNLTIDATSNVPHGAIVSGDAQMLGNALASAVLATLPLLEGVPGRITMNVTLQGGGPAVFTVTQASVQATSAWASRAFDLEWTERPGGEVALVALLAAQRAITAHGGTIALACTDHGTTITMALPAVA